MIPSVFGMLKSWDQFNTYDKQPIRYTNTYRSNPYARQALRGMASLRYNMYPELQAVRDAERRGAYALSNQGGLTAGQRAAARVANTIATQRNLAQTYANASNQNNQYKQNYYKFLLPLLLYLLNYLFESNRINFSFHHMIHFSHYQSHHSLSD